MRYILILIKLLILTIIFQQYLYIKIANKIGKSEERPESIEFLEKKLFLGGEEWVPKTLSVNFSLINSPSKTSTFISRTKPPSDSGILNVKGLINQYFIHFILPNSCKRPSFTDFFQNVESSYQQLKVKNKELIPEPLNSLITATAFHDAGGLPPNIKQQLSNAGFLQLVTPSSYAALLFTYFFAGMAGPQTNRKKVLLASLGVIFFFFVIFGFTIALLRVVITAVLKLVAVYTNRQYSALYGFCLSVAMIIATNFCNLSNFSFYLVCGSSLGIVLWLPVFHQMERLLHGAGARNASQISFAVEKKRRSSWLGTVLKVLRESFYLTVASQFFIIPLLLFHFGELNLLAVLTGTLFLWLTPFLILSAFIMVLLILTAPILLKMILVFIWVPYLFLLKMIAIFNLPIFLQFVIHHSISFNDLVILWICEISFYYFVFKLLKAKNEVKKPVFPKYYYGTKM